MNNEYKYVCLLTSSMAKPVCMTEGHASARQKRRRATPHDNNDNDDDCLSAGGNIAKQHNRRQNNIPTTRAYGLLKYIFTPVFYKA